jgi:ABC-2 type transport system ATP-binding protein
MSAVREELSARSEPAAAAPAWREAAVLTRGLYKGYGDGDRRVEALLGVDLEIHPGEIVGVLGPNGAGKTTMVSILEGVIGADSGEARVLGEDVGSRQGIARVKPRLGVTMQNSVLPPLLKIPELMRFKRTMHPRSRDPDELLEALGLDGKRDALYRTLSGGQQQRVVVAMALVGDPDVLFLDEPTSQLDPQARRAVWDLLADQRRRRDAAILVTTHQMEEAERLCDQVLVLDRGRVIARGRPRDLIAAHCPERNLEFATTRLPADLGGRATVAEPRADGLVPVRLQSDHVETSLTDLLARQARGELVVEDLRITSQTLEDVFIKLTGRGIRG